MIRVGWDSWEDTVRKFCLCCIFLHNYFLLFQRTCRRLLAVYDLPSWGRCELALSLLLEHSAPYSLEDVVQAVRESHDREFIKRVLAKECPICLSVFPHSKVLTLSIFRWALEDWSMSYISRFRLSRPLFSLRCSLWRRASVQCAVAVSSSTSPSLWGTNTSETWCVQSAGSLTSMTLSTSTATSPPWTSR